MESITHESFARSDNEGNVLLVRFTIVNGIRNTANVVLKLKGHTKYRNIGLITMSDGVLHARRKTSMHYHFKSGGFGFNHEMLSEQTLFKIEQIHLIVDDEKHYQFPKSVIDEKGTFLFFKAQAFELQRFLNMKFIEPFERAKIVNTSNIIL